MKWENPPPSRRGVYSAEKWHQAAVELRQWPGRWGRIAEYPRSHTAYTVAHRVRNAGLKAFRPAGAFEARAQAQDGGGVVWARYVGEKS